MLNLNSVMIGTKQSKALATFYEKVIGKLADMVDSENGFYGWQVGSAYLSVLEHSEMAGLFSALTRASGWSLRDGQRSNASRPERTESHANGRD